MERVFVAIDEAAEALGIGRTMTYQLIKEGDLVSAKIGRRSLVTAESVREYAAKVSGVEPRGPRNLDVTQQLRAPCNSPSQSGSADTRNTIANLGTLPAG